MQVYGGHGAHSSGSTYRGQGTSSRADPHLWRAVHRARASLPLSSCLPEHPGDVGEHKWDPSLGPRAFQPPVVLFRDLFSFVSGRFFPRCTEGPEPISFSRVVISGSESTDSVGREVQGTLFVLSRL